MNGLLIYACTIFNICLINRRRLQRDWDYPGRTTWVENRGVLVMSLLGEPSVHSKQESSQFQHTFAEDLLM